MRNILLTVLLLMITCPFIAQDYRAKLLEFNKFDHFAVSPSEDLFYGISEGNLYKANGFNELWHSVRINEAPISDYRTGDFKRVYFITNDILVVFSKEYERGKNLYFIYKSSNRGVTWKRIELGEWDWINDVFIDNNKRIWVSASSSDLYCSKNMGDTWHKIKYPPTFQGKRIKINTDHSGGSFFLTSDGNTVYKTTDKFSDFESINNPILKTKYTELIRPVNKFGQLDDYYLARQEDKVFYSKTDIINWKLITNVTDFVLCDKSKAYVLNDDLSISLLNSSMKIEWTSDKRLKYSSDLYCRNNNLHVFSDRSFYKINKNSFIEQSLYTDDHPIEPTDLKVKWNEEEVCFDGGDVLLFDKQKKQWYRYMTLPIDFSYATIYKEQILLTDYEISNYYLLDLGHKTYKKLILPVNLVDLSKKKVKSFRIEKGSEGCFHFEKEVEDYKYEGGSFIKQLVIKDTSRSLQPKSLELEIRKDAQKINNLLSQINRTAHSRLSIKELQITQKDIDIYKNYIRLKKEELKKSLQEMQIDTNDSIFALSDLIVPEDNSEDYYLYIPENIGAYEKYEILADSIWAIPDSIMNNIFATSSSGLSTNTDWVKLSIYFDDNTLISVSNDDTYPNYLHTPWTIDYEGLKIKTNSFTIGILLNEIGEDKIMLPIFSDKKYAIHQILNYLYQKKEKEGTLDELIYSRTKIPTRSLNYVGTIITASLFIVLSLVFIGGKQNN